MNDDGVGYRLYYLILLSSKLILNSTYLGAHLFVSHNYRYCSIFPLIWMIVDASLN